MVWFKKRKARKTHECHGCLHPIHPKEEYYIGSLVEDGQWHGVKFCECCNDWNNYAWHVHGCDENDGPTWERGGLIEWYRSWE